MSWKGHCKNALFALALASLIAPPAEALEIEEHLQVSALTGVLPVRSAQ